jgi:hypothetical protein
LKCDDIPGCQNHILSGGRIPAFSLAFLFHTEFTETGDQYVMAGFQGTLDKFKHYFDCFECLFLGVPVGFNNDFNDAGFSEGAG